MHRALLHDLQRGATQSQQGSGIRVHVNREVESEDDDDGANESDAEVCAICALPASNGGLGAYARCAGCDEKKKRTGSRIGRCADPTGSAPVSALLSVPEALRRTLRDAIVEASSKVAITGWLGPLQVLAGKYGSPVPERPLLANLSALSAAVLRAAAQRGGFSPDSENPSTAELTAIEVARAVCIGPALIAAASALGSAQLSAPLARTVKLALLACETGVSATVAASRSATFSAAVERLRDAADADAPITLPVLCSAVCAPRSLEAAKAALCGMDRATGLACTKGATHGAGCDCGAVMGGGFL